MVEREREQERAPAAVLVPHGEPARGQRGRKAQPPARQVEVVARPAEDGSALVHRHRQRDRRPRADVLLEPRGPCEALGGVDDLWKAPRTGVEPRPDLPAARDVLRHRDHQGVPLVAPRRQRRADGAQHMGQDGP